VCGGRATHKGIEEEDAEDDGGLDPAVGLALDESQRIRKGRHAKQDLDQPIIKLSEEELPERVGLLDLELVGPVELEQLLSARAAQALLRQHVHLIEKLANRQCVRRRLCARRVTAAEGERGSVLLHRE